ncbi:MAG: hypothetical protein K8R60_13700 [Burkholderiales bacterium]|nr:hypothetical protein [Burkholderiales bacterium]
MLGTGVAADTSEPPFEVALDDPRIFSRAELAIVDSDTPPPAGAAWRPVQLPESWRSPERYRQGDNGWYRFTLPATVPKDPQSVYLWRFSMNAAVYFNGEWIGDGGSFAEPVARNWNRPLIFRLPTAMWRTDRNELMVRLRVYPGFGHMTPVAVGPTALLQPDHDRRYFAQIGLSQVAAVLMALATLSGLVLWLIDRRDTAYLFYAALGASFLVYALNKFIQEIPIPARAWWWLVHSAVDAATLFAVLFAHRALGVRRPRLERAIAAVLLLFVALYALWDLPTLARFNPVTHGIATLGTLYAVSWLLVQWRRRGTLEIGSYGVILLALAAAGVYDQILNSLLFPMLWREGFYLMSLAMPALLLGLMFQLGLRSVRAMQALRVANETLESRVARAGAEIEAIYSRERRLLAERSAGRERERIYRDLHDNLGARLLSLVYGARDDRQRSLARDALSEMRTIVAASQVDVGELSDLAEEWRLEAELRCENAGQELAWSREGDLHLSGRQRYQLERIVRELLSNALEHGQGRRIEVAWRVAADLLELHVSDDGNGIPEGVAPEGVVARAADLDGHARWAARPGGGTEVLVGIPFAATPGLATQATAS